MADIKFGVNQLNNPTPKIWGRISTALRYFMVSAIGVISAADFIPDKTNKWVVFGLSMTILLLKTIDMGLGVQEKSE